MLQSIVVCVWLFVYTLCVTLLLSNCMSVSIGSDREIEYTGQGCRSYTSLNNNYTADMQMNGYATVVYFSSCAALITIALIPH